MRRSKHGPDPETQKSPQPPESGGKKPTTPTKKHRGYQRGGKENIMHNGLSARVPSADERAMRRATITAMLNACESKERIIEECSKKFGMSAHLTNELIARIRNERGDQFDADRPRYKSEQATRLQASIARMLSKKDPPYGTIARYEEMLMRIVGTAEPVRVETTVNVSVRESLVACIHHMDDDVLDAIAIEQLELEAVAKSARALMGMGSLDTVGEAVIGQGEDVANVPVN